MVQEMKQVIASVTSNMHVKQLQQVVLEPCQMLTVLEEEQRFTIKNNLQLSLHDKRLCCTHTPDTVTVKKQK